MNSGIWRGKINLSKEFKRNIRKGVSVLLSVAMVAGSVSFTNVGAVTVSAAENVQAANAATGTYVLGAGQKINASTLFNADTGYGFSDVAYADAAKGWVGGIYYPREAKVTAGSASYVTDAAGYLEIASKVWTETEETGYGVYTYENTSTLDFVLDNADYKVSVELVNPTDKDIVVSLEAEDITKASGVKVAAGATITQDITACLVDGVLNLKFLETSGSATKEEEAATGKVYVSKVIISKVPTKTAGEKPTIFIASDSTVQTYESNYYPQTGWGQTLHNFFGDLVEERECDDCNYSQAQTYETTNVIVENRAIGGRSSKSFIEEGKLDDLLEDIKPGDYVLVQWGHNDATAARPNRYVSPEDFAYWMQYYVDGVTQRGATPVLVTPVARYSYTTNEDGTLKSFVGNFEKYGDVMRKMAEEQNIPIVDLTARSTALCNEFGIEGAKSLFLILEAGDYPEGAYAGGANDSTHLQYYGAYKFAQCVAEGIVDYAKDGATDALDSLAKLVVNKAPTKAPGKVENLISTTVGSSSVGLQWDAEDDSELYYIYRAVLEDGQTIADVDFSNAEKYSVSSKNKYTDTACKAGLTYVYAVRGFNPKGLGEFSNMVQVTTKTAGWKFDINGDKDTIAKADGPTDKGWTGIGAEMYDKSVGYGWITRPGTGRDRGEQTSNSTYSLMGRDFTLGAGEFALDIPNGDYEVTCYGGDLLPGTSTIKTSFGAEGKSIGSISVKQGVAGATGNVRVEDGQLNITTDNYFNGFTVTEILKAPSSLVASEKTVNGSNMTFLLGFSGVDEAVSYNVYRKSSSDDAFTLVKSFTTEEYKKDELGCRAMTAALGETYQYYMTCVTADGTESARSNVETVEAVLDTVKVPAAPTGVVCVDPTSATSGVQSTITISWNAAAVADASNGKVIKYIIYRSAKAEGEKGFKGFEKVGETTETTFKDTYKDLDTNISYYYKVAALNAGGLGELSAVCKTPVTGTLTQQNLEKYADRALVAVNLAGEKGAETLISATDKDGNTLTKGVYLSWRSFNSDFDGNNNLKTTFTVYRDGEAIASNVSVTNMVDEAGTSSSVYKVVGSNDSAIGVNAVDTKAWDHQYLELNLFAPADETVPAYNDQPTTCDYSANDMSLGDLDGDGVLELIVKWYPSNAKDNSGYGFTGKTFLDAYDVDWATGKTTLLYRIDMGVNIRSGAHYTQFQVWDYDGDGKAEIAVKTAPGTTVLRPTDGTANTLAEVQWIDVPSSSLPTETVSASNDYRNASGYVLDGPEYFTMFNGEDGSILDTTNFVPARGNVGAWGDAYGNRVDRFLSATAYLDGEKPYAVFSRGYYTRTCLTAYYVNDEGKLDVYWAFDTNEAGSQYESQGNHGLSVNDVDNDGKDEIIYGSLTVDHDGTAKYTTGLGHGDAMHVSDWVAWNDGLEIMDVHEHDDATYHVEIHDAETGEILMGYWTGTDTGRGVAGDIDPTSAGAEWWAVAGPNYQGADEPSWDSTDGDVYSTQSRLGLENLIKLADNTPSANATIFWDGDLLTEIQDHSFNKEAYMPTGVKLYKWDYENNKQVELLSSTEIWSSNGTKGNLGIIADFLGDWREEIIARCADDKNKVRVYTTTIQTDYVVPCLLENLAYREGVAWENVGYNQPANLSYLLSEGLITAQLKAGSITKGSAEIAFTEASDGTYGHEVTGYEIYRAEGDGEFELIDTIKKDDLKEYVPGEEPEEPEKPSETPSETPTTPEEDPVYLKFDFGNGEVEDGWTQVLAADEYSDEKGYGFVFGDGLAAAGQDKTYVSNAESLAAVADDSVLGWDATNPMEFDVKVPNGTYNVTYYIYNGSGYVYNKITAENVELGDVRRGNSDKQFTSLTAEVTVTDGVLNILNQSSKTNMYSLYFTGIEVKDVNYKDDKPETPSETPSETPTTPEKDPVDLKFDFGAGTVEDGWTQVLAADEYSDEKGYGFVFGDGLAAAGSEKAYTSDEESLAAVANDCVMGWDAKNPMEFDVKVPNGTYNVTYYIYNGSGYVYNKITAEGVELGDVRRGNSDKQFTNLTAKVTVTDGVLNIVNQSSKTNMSALYFTGLEIKEVTTDSASTASEVAEESQPSEELTISLNNVRTVAASDSDKTVKYYSYVDKTVKSDAVYRYKIAAVVDGKTSFMSRELEIHTLVDIDSVDDFELDDLVQDQVIPAGQTLVDLFPAKISVTDKAGNKTFANATWDVSKVDIKTVGEYEVTCTIAGYDEPIVKTVKVVKNELTGYAPFEDITVIVGNEPKLPEKVTVTFKNGTTKTETVTWNTENLDIKTAGEYVLVGTSETVKDAKITIKVVANYIVSLYDRYAEIYLNETDYKLPADVLAVWGDETTSYVSVEWDTTTPIDVTALGTTTLTGTVEGFDGEAKLQVTVEYPVAKRFDFGITGSNVEDGWIGIAANPKSGKKTVDELGTTYSEEKGYGFLDGTKVFEGRDEGLYKVGGQLADSVYRDYVIPDGNVFRVDVPNGKYVVELVGGCAVGSSTIIAQVNGVDISVKNGKADYAINEVEVEVTEGYINIDFNGTGTLSRTCAAIIRTIEAEKPEHNHEFAESWTSDADGHWHKCLAPNCDITEPEKEAHTPGEWEISKQPTTTEFGQQVKKCTVCGYVVEKEELPKLHAHDFATEWSSDADAHWHACTAEGCDGTVKDKAAHTASDWIVEKVATTTEEGLKYKECTVCGYRMAEETIAKVVEEVKHEHVFSDTWSTSGTEHWHACTADGCDGTVADKAAHTVSDWKVVKEATTQEEGARQKECTVCGAVLETQTIPKLSEKVNGFDEDNGVTYWYENGVRQGVDLDDPNYRGKEIYDPESDAWYWLDAVQNGAITKGKDVYQESTADDEGNVGKWVRYDADGHMVKGWDEASAGTYYFDPVYGTMAKGEVEIDGKTYVFDEITGIMVSDENGKSLYEDGFHTVNGVEYWYEGGARQGFDAVDSYYAGKEIYDPESDAWYWLDNVDNGAITRNKDVYQNSLAGQWGESVNADGERVGKWVRYDENGRMVKGWDEKDGNRYYFDPVYGTMAKGDAVIDGEKYFFNPITGILE